ncbi:PQQ-dependent sugar dehydrogenase [Elioraea rosea]|uniref:PQQ-dependent sugar dehydrogenase n=1 Tax=Elioraea rosea TaxID=2492390 RepID=UPI0011825001|nr:PQQ-dependent sugar dehydrogenase [Elioraea rosea]
MATIIGNDSANAQTGTSGADLIYGFDPDAGGRSASPIDVVPIVSGLSQPLFLTSAPDDPTRLFVVEKGGQIEIVDTATNTRAGTAFLDVSGQIATAGEQGLLGLALHPQYAGNGRAYVYLVNPAGDSEIREYRASASNPNRLDPASARPVMTIDQPSSLTNHKGGWMGFGPDGLLYIATGDGGGTGDPSGNAQNIGSLLGKMLRIDINGDAFPADANRNYAIPAGNPFVNVAGLDEIFATGFRNPWRDSFDRATGELWIADVGQGAREEINLGARGANYGWNLYEGSLPFAGGSSAGLTFPIFDYGHAGGDRSVTGGYVHRGGGSEGLHGAFVFGDFISGRIWSLSDASGAWQRTLKTEVLDNVASFGEDAEGNLYGVDFDGGIFRLAPRYNSADQADTINAGAGNDVVFSGAGNDTVRGQGGADRIAGMDGDDTLEGGDGGDVIAGNAGRDVLRGEAGDDVLMGGAGDDVMNGGAGADRLYGGAGRDLASWWGSAAGVTVNLAAGTASGGDAAGDRLSSIEDMRGTRFADRLIGSSGANRLEGWEGNDTMTGGGGADSFVVQGPNDGLADRVTDFSQADGDRIDLSLLDGGSAPGDQGFAFVGTGAYLGRGVGSVRFAQWAGDTLVGIDFGDGVTDLRIYLTGTLVLTASDLVL